MEQYHPQGRRRQVGPPRNGPVGGRPCSITTGANVKDLTGDDDDAEAKKDRCYLTCLLDPSSLCCLLGLVRSNTKGIIVKRENTPTSKSPLLAADMHAAHPLCPLSLFGLACLWLPRAEVGPEGRYLILLMREEVSRQKDIRRSSSTPLYGTGVRVQ